jgi:hypothetical protein
MCVCMCVCPARRILIICRAVTSRYTCVGTRVRSHTYICIYKCTCVGTRSTYKRFSAHTYAYARVWVHIKCYFSHTRSRGGRERGLCTQEADIRTSGCHDGAGGGMCVCVCVCVITQMCILMRIMTCICVSPALKVLATNTSSISITKIASTVSKARAPNVIGMHFFRSV